MELILPDVQVNSDKLSSKLVNAQLRQSLNLMARHFHKQATIIQVES